MTDERDALTDRGAGEPDRLQRLWTPHRMNYIVDVPKKKSAEPSRPFTDIPTLPDEDGLVSRLLAEDAIVVAASAGHELFRGTPTLKDLTRYRWALQPPGAPTRDWLDHTFDRKRLPRPQVQVESTMLLVLPALIEQTGLLSFISRHHLGKSNARTGLKEVPVKDVVMRRQLVVSHRSPSFLSPLASRVIDLFATQPKHKLGP